MGKIRVQDLARMMGVSNQDLVFKLKSIGVRVEGDDAQIDTDIIQAILQGKKLPHPREVILRDQEEPQESPPARRRRAMRRPPANPLRPNRPRTQIKRADSKIPTLPATEKPEDKARKEKEQEERAGEVAAETRAAQEEAAPVEEAPPAPPEEVAAEEEPPAREAPVDKQEAPEEKAAPAASAEVAEEEEEERDRKKRKKKAKRAKKAPAEEEDLKAYRGAVEDLEEVEAEHEGVPAAEARRQRRAERKKKQREGGEGGKVLAFEKGKPEGPVMITEGMTVRDFADKLGVKSKELIKALFQRGIVANINQVLEPELAEQLAEDLGVEAMVVSFEEEVQLTEEMELAKTGEEEEEAGKVTRAPVVTVMGHVDHGKTSLLDAVRQAEVAESEAGGITQHIGAYQVDVNGRKIVFLDTPGHEAFTMMRSRGAKATDLVILVVAADDGVMPQTIEAIDHAKAAKVPLIVAINKMDKPNANPDKVKKELADQELVVEEWGGDTVAVGISAIKGEGIDELLEMVLLNADLLDLKANPEISAQGVVIEARKETGRGTVATVLVQNGTLEVGDPFVSGSTWGRVRSMLDDHGQRIEAAGPATPVEVSGFQELPTAGDILQVVEDESKARSVADYRLQEKRQKELAPSVGKVTLEDLFDKMEAGEVKELPVVVKADVQGSVEVLRDALAKLSTEKVKLSVIHAAVGAISTNDVLLASASDAIVIGFNVRPEKNAVDLAEKEEVDIRLHTVIYELMDELRGAMTGLLEPIYKEVVQGKAEVREIFKVPKAGTVAGCHVVDGVIPRNAGVRLLRDNRVVYEGTIASLKRFKDDASEVRQGFDCGIGLERFQDIKPGDVIEAFVKEEVAPEL